MSVLAWIAVGLIVWCALAAAVGLLWGRIVGSLSEREWQ